MKNSFQQHFRTTFYLVFVLVVPARTMAQRSPGIDSTYIQSFVHENVFELYPGVTTTRFTFSRPGVRRSDYRIIANRSAYVGSYLNYKWLSLKYSFSMPGVNLNDQVRNKFSSVDFKIPVKQLMIHPFYDNYDGLLLPGHRRSDFQLVHNVAISDAGVDLSLATNREHFSYSAANYFQKRQLKSAGAFIAMITPMWQQIHAVNPPRAMIKDSATFRLFTTSPQWVSLTGHFGYNYNLVFGNGRWSIAPALMAGYGLLRELNTTQKGLQTVSDIRGWINAGYNGRDYYIYLQAAGENLQTNLFIKNMHQVITDCSMTAGIRFGDAGKKLAWIL